MSKNFIVIKSQDRGGSHFIKHELLPKFQTRNNYIYDINNEYGMFKNKIWDYFDDLPDINEFINFVPHKKDSFANVIFEEATGFFSRAGSSSNNILKHVTRRFHSQNLNVFVFHSLLKIPNDIRSYMDFLVLFRTDDDPIEVAKDFKSFPRIVSSFNRIQTLTEGTEFNRELKTYPDQRSKEFFHYKEVIAK